MIILPPFWAFAPDMFPNMKSPGNNMLKETWKRKGNLAASNT
jgi:hypothetical protein